MIIRINRMQMPVFHSSAGEAALLDTEAATSRTERRDQQVARILDAAKTCFVRSGFQGASMQQICSEVGMSPGALYRYFPSKEAIIEAITEADRRRDAEIFSVLTLGGDVVDGFVAAAMAHIRYMHESGNAPLFAEIRAESMRNDAIDFACKMSMKDVDDSFRSFLRGAVDRGEIDPCADLDTILPVMVAFGEGLAINDLPAQGVDFERLEVVIRAIATAVLRPTGRSTAS
ncbi:TetR/AcrR family transcriptional regulator [Aquibium carbonis]|uniref:TetR/AcrR family transcriptional regulator n=2 Tax=Aquibium carbonis TaxID=2495581 RepID=A0A3R9YBC5_9HYPH|nr:TetR/AcrR family transcriptional regulator [Aquibium carbonis]